MQGDYFIRIDADDYISSYTLNFLYSITEFYPKMFGIACDYALIKGEDKQIKELSSKDNPISCGILYNRKNLLNTECTIQNLDIERSEELRIRLGSKYTIYNLNLPLYRYRVHNDNKTNLRTTFYRL